MQQQQQKSVAWSTTPNRVHIVPSPSDYDRSYKNYNHNNTNDNDVDEEPPSQEQLLDTLYKYPAGAVRDHMAKIMGITNYNKSGGSNKTRKRKNTRKTKRIRNSRNTKRRRNSKK
jgi:hypothetical protein